MSLRTRARWPSLWWGQALENWRLDAAAVDYIAHRSHATRRNDIMELRQRARKLRPVVYVSGQGQSPNPDLGHSSSHPRQALYDHRMNLLIRRSPTDSHSPELGSTAETHSSNGWPFKMLTKVIRYGRPATWHSSSENCPFSGPSLWLYYFAIECTGSPRKADHNFVYTYPRDVPRFLGLSRG